MLHVIGLFNIVKIHPYLTFVHIHFCAFVLRLEYAHIMPKVIVYSVTSQCYIWSILRGKKIHLTTADSN